MTAEKFEKEVITLHKFIQLYCDRKHKEVEKTKSSIKLSYENRDLGKIEYNLCKECEKILKIAYKHLLSCPYDEKPRCRKCPAPCYKKEDWEHLLKIMKYSGMQLGLAKIGKWGQV